MTCAEWIASRVKPHDDYIPYWAKDQLRDDGWSMTDEVTDAERLAFQRGAERALEQFGIDSTLTITVR